MAGPKSERRAGLLNTKDEGKGSPIAFTTICMSSHEPVDFWPNCFIWPGHFCCSLLARAVNRAISVREAERCCGLRAQPSAVSAVPGKRLLQLRRHSARHFQQLGRYLGTNHICVFSHATRKSNKEIIICGPAPNHLCHLSSLSSSPGMATGQENSRQSQSASPKKCAPDLMPPLPLAPR